VRPYTRPIALPARFQLPLLNSFSIIYHQIRTRPRIDANGLSPLEVLLYLRPAQATASSGDHPRGGRRSDVTRDGQLWSQLPQAVDNKMKVTCCWGRSCVSKRDSSHCETCTVNYSRTAFRTFISYRALYSRSVRLRIHSNHVQRDFCTRCSVRDAQTHIRIFLINL